MVTETEMRDGSLVVRGETWIGRVNSLGTAVVRGEARPKSFAGVTCLICGWHKWRTVTGDLRHAVERVQAYISEHPVKAALHEVAGEVEGATWQPTPQVQAQGRGHALVNGRLTAGFYGWCYAECECGWEGSSEATESEAMAHFTAHRDGEGSVKWQSTPQQQAQSEAWRDPAYKVAEQRAEAARRSAQRGARNRRPFEHPAIAELRDAAGHDLAIISEGKGWRGLCYCGWTEVSLIVTDVTALHRVHAKGGA